MELAGLGWRYEDGRAMNEHAWGLAETLAEVGAAPNVDSAAEALLRGAINLLGGCHGVLRLYDPREPDGQTIRYELTLEGGDDGERCVLHRSKQRPPLPNGIAARLRDGEPSIIVEDTHALDAVTHPWVERAKRRGHRASVNVPLGAVGQRSGSMGIDHRVPAAFGPAAVAMAEALATMAGSVIARVQASERLRESEERFRQLTEHIHEVFWMTSLDKHAMLYVSPGYELIWGRSCESLYTAPETWLDSIHEDDRERVRHAALTKQETGSYDETYRIVRPEGGERWVRDRAFPVRDATGAVYRIVGIVDDVTAAREAAALLAERERLSGALLVARTTAHEINNALSPIGGFAELLTNDPVVASSPRAATYATLIAHAAADMAGKVRRLQGLVRLEQTESPMGADLPILDLERSTRSN
jgi:PAS domain S-box-containing protein